MWYDDVKKFIFSLGERNPRRRIRPPKPAVAEIPRPAALTWREIIEETNKALVVLEKNGVDLHGYRVTEPPKPVAEMNSRIEEQLLRMGIPAHIHSVLTSTLASYVFGKEIEDKTTEAVLKSGILPDDPEAELTQEQQNKIWEIQGYISLQMCCRAIGVEASKEEAQEVVKAVRKWEKKEGE